MKSEKPHSIHLLPKAKRLQEFLDRPTAQADWWASPNSNVLGGRDLQRQEHGTWLGITKQGRIAVLTNFREDGPVHPEAISRGAIVNMFLMQETEREDRTQDFVRKLLHGGSLTGVGGFSLVCGRVGEALAVVSNRSSRCGEPCWILDEPGQTVALSNAAFDDHSWPKVTRGKDLLSETIERDLAHKKSKVAFIESLFEILGDDTLPRSEVGSKDWDSQVQELRESIFIPVVGGSADGIYGTQKQTVVLVDQKGHVTFRERTLYFANGERNRDNCDRSFEFDVDR